MKVRSPLNSSDDVSLLRVIPTAQLICDWYKTFQIDISTELLGNEYIYLYRCNETGLRFFYPLDVAGSAALYKNLSVFDWYYMGKKWEHDVAIKDLSGCQTILEVGCGKGDFVKRLCEEKKKEAEGIEMSLAAVILASDQRIPVTHTEIEKLSRYKQEYFDAVCSFQVLEHVADPLSFINSMLKLLKPGGRLIISVPNNNSFVGDANENLLDQPPHHMTQWTIDVFRSLIETLPLSLHKIRIEPLASYHVDWYIATLEKVYSRKKSFSYIRKALTLYRMWLKRVWYFRYCVSGHTLYVSFTKI